MDIVRDRATLVDLAQVLLLFGLGHVRVDRGDDTNAVKSGASILALTHQDIQVQLAFHIDLDATYR